MDDVDRAKSGTSAAITSPSGFSNGLEWCDSDVPTKGVEDSGRPPPGARSGGAGGDRGCRWYQRPSASGRRVQPSALAVLFLAVLSAVLAALLIACYVELRRTTATSAGEQCAVPNGAVTPSALGREKSKNNSSAASTSGGTADNGFGYRSPEAQEEGQLRGPWTQIRLPTGIRPVSYRLTLYVDPNGSSFRGSTEIDLVVLDEGDGLDFVALHAVDLNVDVRDVRMEQRDKQSGYASGNPVSIRRLRPAEPIEMIIVELSERLVAGQRYSLVFTNYTSALADDMRGLYRSTYRDENGRQRFLVTSQLQSTDARRVFPCFDEPGMKATFDVAIIHRKEFQALSNMPLVNSTRMPSAEGEGEGNYWIKDEFEQTPVMATYLLAFVVADFSHRETTGPNGLRIRIWSRPNVFNQTAYALQLASQAYDFYTRYFDTPEVVPKADHAAIPDFSAGAMENWGLVLYRESTLLHDDTVSSMSNMYWVSLVVAHEISHTWFGNMVTMAWWDDLWLNEGFANTLMYFALDSIYPSWKVFDLQLVNNIYPAMTKDALLTSHPISSDIVYPEDIALSFDSISYDKGMAVLRLLRGFLGWDGFRDGLKQYVTTFQFANANMSQLWTTFDNATGNRFHIGDVMNTWTRQMGFPVVTVSRVIADDGGVGGGGGMTEGHVRYLLNQTRFLLNPDDSYNPAESAYRYKWKIPFIYQIEGDSVERTQWIDMTSAYITVPSGRWVLGNVNYMGFYRTNYDEAMWKQLINQLLTDHTVFSASSRAGLISDAFNLARANQLSYDVAFNLTSYLHAEHDYVPWAAFFDAMDFIDGMLATSDTYGLLQKYMRQLLEPQYKRIGTSDTGEMLDRNMRSSMLSAACSSNVPEAVDWARKTFDLWMNNGTKIVPDYAGVVYSMGIQYGGEEEWDFLWNRTQSTVVVSEAETMLTALARTRQPWLLWRYVRMSLDVTKVRTQDIRNQFRFYTSTPLGRLITLQFLLTYWEEMNIRFEMDPFLLRDVIIATTQYVNTEHDYELLERRYSNGPASTAGVVGKTASSSLAVVRSNINWLTLHYETISRWLATHVQSPSTD